MYSREGGTGWAQQKSLDLQSLRAIYFVDADHGWVVGWPGVVFHTENGGLTWEKQDTHTLNELSGLHFVDREYGWVVGQFGGGLAFNGTTTFMEVPHHELLNLGANFTITAWSLTNALPAQHIGLPRKEAEYVMHPTEGGDFFNLRFYIGQGRAWAAPVVSDGHVNYGDWAHIAGTYDGETLKSWIDGEVSAEAALPGEAAPTTNVLRWSNDCCGGRMYDGVLDEIRSEERRVGKEGRSRWSPYH